MKFYKSFIIAILLILFFSLGLNAQYQQTIRGKVIDSDSQFPLIGVNVIVVNSDPFIGASTDENGRYELRNVPIGKVTIKATSIGYKEFVQSNILVLSGKETILNFQLEETIIELNEISVTASKSLFDTKNDMISVSARSFDAEQTSRFAGSRNDPARMAANYAGVSGANDSRNDIIIRGNTPTGVLWRLEGIDIHNPNHFASFGSTGGPVSMLNNNVLAKSDFITSAFPAEYGNGISGVFDLYLRNGNTQKNEFLGQIGFNGFELGAEGPLGVSDNSSYLVNYRYTFLGVLKSFGVEFGTGTAVPYYQDLNFKVNIPTSNSGTFTMFGLAGISHIDLVGSDIDLKNDSDMYGNENENIYDKASLGVTGISHTYFLNKNTFYKFSLGYTLLQEEVNIDSINSINRSDITRYINVFNKENRYSLNLLLNSKLDSRNNLTLGINANNMFINFYQNQLRRNVWYDIKRGNETTQLYRAYANLKHKFTEDLIMNAGLHFMNFALNDKSALEPRIGFSYNFGNTQTLSLGYGLHSQTQILPTYFNVGKDANGNSTFNNKEMGFTKSHHFVLGYEIRPTIDFRIKAEAYYQYLFNVPVESFPSSFSMLNAGADFTNPDNTNLVNNGKGKNYGVELTIEKILTNDFYALVTTSLFQSEYLASDNKWRNTAFNGNYVINILTGKEFKIGTNSLIFDIKATFAGGRYYSPIDIQKSIQTGREEIIDDKAYTLQYDPYFRSDFKVTYRINSSSITQEYILEIQNLTNQKNIFRKAFNRRTGSISSEYQLGIFPVMQYRILF